MKPADLVEYANFSKDLLAWTQAFPGYSIGTGFGGIKGNIQAIYDELNKK